MNTYLYFVPAIDAKMLAISAFSQERVMANAARAASRHRCTHVAILNYGREVHSFAV